MVWRCCEGEPYITGSDNIAAEVASEVLSGQGSSEDAGGFLGDLTGLPGLTQAVPHHQISVETQRRVDNQLEWRRNN